MEETFEDNINNINKKDFEKLLLKNQHKIFGYALKLTKDSNDAQDLLQEVNLKALNNFDKYNHEQKFISWILLITRNTFINKYKEDSRHNENRIDYDPYQLQECNLFSKDADSDIIYSQLFESIKNEKDFLLISGLINGYKYKELSEILELSIGTVKSRIHLLRKRIIQKLTK